jgi:hypothetical protein
MLHQVSVANQTLLVQLRGGHLAARREGETRREFREHPDATSTLDNRFRSGGGVFHFALCAFSPLLICPCATSRSRASSCANGKVWGRQELLAARRTCQLLSEEALSYFGFRTSNVPRGHHQNQLNYMPSSRPFCTPAFPPCSLSFWTRKSLMERCHSGVDGYLQTSASSASH